MHHLLETVCDIALIWITVLLFYINLCVDLLNLFTEDEFKLEMFVAIGWDYGKWGISIVWYYSITF